ncbi:MAG TPA: porphobilinogen synthase [Oligoflexia bacterium]|nr:porphobilinogen synthase [Oligoflexia bacterium]HMP27266.1 porphobilinogen synthase [Oligoflexia bacterium]
MSLRRLQRLRRTKVIRDMLSDVGFSMEHLIQPIFAVEGISQAEPILGLKDNYRLPVNQVLAQIESDYERGVRNFLLFPVPAKKMERNFSGKFAADLIKKVKDKFTDQISIWVDICLCSYNVDGHCCIYDQNGVHNLSASLQELANLAKEYALSGADGVAPSDMNDGRTAVIRQTLDEVGRDCAAIMSYSAKFASNFYGPFRNACDSPPRFGDRKQYQIDVRSRRDALASSLRCYNEGADLLMVKPAMSSIDLIAPIKESSGAACGAYQVSGEFASLTLLSDNGLVDFQAALKETLLVLRRAGANFIITYGARHAAEIGLAPSF